ncbi:hypothetical protein V8F20_001489 [Naviculisporaceae sp. PSN 640]
MLEGSTIAAILTGILALLGAIGTAWMSGWNEHRIESRNNRKVLARYSVPLLIASWDLANWLYDILEDDYYSPKRCAAYGDGWNSMFTSYLFGQYFAGVHIVREMTQFFSHIRGGKGERLKTLIWKIQDEFISMKYEEREDLELRWVERDVLAVQEVMTVPCDNPDFTKEHPSMSGGGLRTMSWIEFQRNYELKQNEKDESMELKKIFEWYEEQFQRIVYRRFKYLYSTKWTTAINPQGEEKVRAKLEKGSNMYCIKNLEEEENMIVEERNKDPDNIVVVIPDHRVRRLQHLLVDLVRLLDEVSSMKFNRPVRRCKMLVDRRVLADRTLTPLNATGYRIHCDCYTDPDCNPDNLDFGHRDLPMEEGKAAFSLSRKGTMTYPQPPTPPSEVQESRFGVRTKESGGQV